MNVTFFVKSEKKPINEKGNVIGCDFEKDNTSCKKCKVIKVDGICNFARMIIKKNYDFKTMKAR